MREHTHACMLIQAHTGTHTQNRIIQTLEKEGTPTVCKNVDECEGHKRQLLAKKKYCLQWRLIGYINQT